MEWKKIAPWNWFKDEEAQTATAASRGVGPIASSDPFIALRTEMERLFDDTFRRTYPGAYGPSDSSNRFPAVLRPSIDVSEGKKAYTVRAELPGVESEDVSVEVDGQRLMIRAEKRQQTEEEEEGYHCVESSYGAVQRVLSLPEDADSEAIKASFKNGVLKLRIPKHAARASVAQNIEIEKG